MKVQPVSPIAHSKRPENNRKDAEHRKSSKWRKRPPETDRLAKEPGKGEKIDTYG